MPHCPSSQHGFMAESHALLCTSHAQPGSSSLASRCPHRLPHEFWALLHPFRFGVVLLLGLLAVPWAGAQVIRGTVIDAETGVALTAASVQVQSTYRGTITNRDGHFELRVDALPATLEVRFIGYETTAVYLEEEPAEELVLRLVPTAYMMPPITVSGEDPAIAIMREVIRRKQEWRADLESYEALGYGRMNITSDTAVVWVSESASTAYWDRERGMRERIIGNRSTDNPILEESVMPVAQVVANLYDDDLFIAGHTLIGVTHPDALDRYDFSLEGTRSLDGRIVYDIAVEPKNRFLSAFHGRVAVLDSAYAMIEAELAPGESFMFPLPIKRYEVVYRQQFSSFGGEYWMPIDLRSSMIMEISFPGFLTFPEFEIDRVARFTDYQVNVPLPEDLYEDESENTVVDSAAVESNEVFEEPGLVIPLTTEEEEAYENPDIADDFEEAFTPGGVGGRYIERQGGIYAMTDSDSAGTDSGGGGGPALLRNIDVMATYNRVEGARLILGRTQELGRYFTLRGGVGINSGLRGADQIPWYAGARFNTDGRVAIYVEGTYESRVAVRYDDHLYRDWYIPLINGMAMLAGRDDNFDYFGSVGWTATAGLELWQQRLEVSGTFRDEDHHSLSATTHYDMVGRRPWRPNPAIAPGRFQSVMVEVGIGRGGGWATIGPSRFLRVAAELSTPQSDYSYQRASLRAGWRFITFGSRRLLPSTLDVLFTAGVSTEGLPLQRAFAVGSQRSPLLSVGELRAIRGRPFEGDKMVGFFWEHNFRTLPFELLGLRSLAQQGFNIMVHGGHARTWLHAESGAHPDTFVRLSTDGFYHEVGIGIGGLFGFARIDVIQPLSGGVPTVRGGAHIPF